MPFLTTLPRHPNQGEDPWYAAEEAWKDGVELNLDELEGHAETHDALTSHLPTGGTTGQVLLKNSNSNFDTTWGAGVGGGVSDHGALTGLADDDHPQYLTGAEGAATYSVLSHTHSYEPIGSAAAAVTAHEGASDPHPQYLTPAEAGALYAVIAAAVPAGGASGQVLTKSGAGDYALAWTTPSGGGGAASPLTLTSTAIGQVPLTVKGFAGQTGNLAEARLSDNTLVWAILPTQETRLGPNVSTQNGTHRIGISDPARRGLLVKMAAAQVGNPIHVTDDTNVEKYSVNKDGTISGLNLGGTYGIVGNKVLDATEPIPTGLPGGTVVLRMQA